MFHSSSHLKLVAALSGVCLFATLSSVAVNFAAVDAKSKAPYGLGLPRTARTGTAIRGNLPLIALLVPPDGARTVAAHPTFYWYFSPDGANSQKRKDFKVTFYLRDEQKNHDNKIFEVEGKANHTGIYKFALPESYSSLEVGKVRRWHLRFEERGNPQGLTANLYSLILRTETNLEMQEKLSQATTGLEKARIYNTRCATKKLGRKQVFKL